MFIKHNGVWHWNWPQVDNRPDTFAEYRINDCGNYALFWRSTEYNDYLIRYIYAIFAADNSEKEIPGRGECDYCDEKAGKFYTPSKYREINIKLCSSCRPLNIINHVRPHSKSISGLKINEICNKIFVEKIAIRYDHAADPIYYISATIPKHIIYERCNIHNCAIYDRNNFADGHLICLRKKQQTIDNEIIYNIFMLNNWYIPRDIINIIVTCLRIICIIPYF